SVAHQDLPSFPTRRSSDLSGGENATAPSGSAFFQSTDGGTTWKELDEKSAKGLPAKPWGRIAVTIAPSKPNVVYAMIESTRSARSEEHTSELQSRGHLVCR